MLHHCPSCSNQYFGNGQEEECSVCNSDMKVDGPIYSRPLHSPEFISLLQSMHQLGRDYESKKIAGLLEMLGRQESLGLLDLPFSYETDYMSKVLGISSISQKHIT